MSRIAVIIPAFNVEAYIGEALGSIREQMLPDVEVLVIDDGSTDGTVREARRFEGSLHLTVIQKANAGPAAARNTGLRHTRSRFCAFLDADDVMLPGRLAAQAEMLEANADVGLVHSDLMTFNEKGIIHTTRRAFSVPYEGMVLDQLLLDNFISTSTVMAPTERLLMAGPFDEARRRSEDFELWLKMAARWKVAYIDRPLVRYRYRHGSLSEDKLVMGMAALDVIQTFWAQHPEYREAKSAICRRSIARHLSVIGSAALGQGRRAQARAYLLRSLSRDPGNGTVWKLLARTVLASAQRPDRRSSVRAR